MTSFTHSYRDLVAWQKAMDLVDVAYDLSLALPASERFGIADQMRRAAVSVPANIAEGATRDSTKDFLRFISIARASLAEVLTYAEIIRRRHMGSDTMIDDLLRRSLELERILSGLRRSLRKKLR